jgi:tetratricopeptide (TPR) repeat protein
MGQALDFASKAVAIDPENVIALKALATVQFTLGNFDEAERIQRQALALNPNDPEILAQLGWRLAFRGRWDEGLPYCERAIARTINPPGWYYDPIAIHHYLEGSYREMLAAAEHSAAGDSVGVALLAIAHGALGNHVQAQEALDTMAKQAPAFNRDPAAVYRRFHPLESIVDALMDGLRKAGWTEPGAPAAAAGDRP